MEDWQRVGPQDMLEEGQLREIVIDDREILLVRAEGAYYATQTRCPHLRVHLVRGRLENTILVCPAHGSRFDVTSGANVAWIDRLPGLVKGVARALSSPKDLETFPTKVGNGQVWVRV